MKLDKGETGRGREMKLEGKRLCQEDRSTTERKRSKENKKQTDRENSWNNNMHTFMVHVVAPTQLSALEVKFIVLISELLLSCNKHKRKFRNTEGKTKYMTI